MYRLFSSSAVELVVMKELLLLPEQLLLLSSVVDNDDDCDGYVAPVAQLMMLVFMPVDRHCDQPNRSYILPLAIL